MNSYTPKKWKPKWKRQIPRTQNLLRQSLRKNLREPVHQLLVGAQPGNGGREAALYPYSSRSVMHCSSCRASWRQMSTWPTRPSTPTSTTCGCACWGTCAARPHMVLTKVLCDQALHVPLVVSAFYTHVNTLQRKNDIILDLENNSRIHLSGPWCASLLYSWPTSACSCSLEKSFHWTLAFFCFSQQSGHGTLKSTFTFLNIKEANAVERAPEKWEVKNSL